MKRGSSRTTLFRSGSAPAGPDAGGPYHFRSMTAASAATLPPILPIAPPSAAAAMPASAPAPQPANMEAPLVSGHELGLVKSYLAALGDHNADAIEMRRLLAADGIDLDAAPTDTAPRRKRSRRAVVATPSATREGGRAPRSSRSRSGVAPRPQPKGTGSNHDGAAALTPAAATPFHSQGDSSLAESLQGPMRTEEEGPTSFESTEPVDVGALADGKEKCQWCTAVLDPLYVHAEIVGVIAVNGMSSCATLPGKLSSSSAAPFSRASSSRGAQTSFVLGAVPLAIDGARLVPWMSPFEMESSSDGFEATANNNARPIYRYSMRVTLAGDRVLELPDAWQVPNSRYDSWSAALSPLIATVNVTEEEVEYIRRHGTTVAVTFHRQIGYRAADGTLDLLNSENDIPTGPEDEFEKWSGSVAVFLSQQIANPFDRVLDVARSLPTAREREGSLGRSVSVGHHTTVVGELGLAVTMSATSTQVSALCPFLRTRMTHPCRGRDCQHDQCFELAFFVAQSRQKRFWVCPVCMHSLPWRALLLDESQQRAFIDAPYCDAFTVKGDSGVVIANMTRAEVDALANRTTVEID